MLEQGTEANGTVTDINGRFNLEVTHKASLTISYIGYVNQTVSLNGKKSITITLQEDSQELEEIVVIGYGTQKKVNLTGSVASINSKTIENVPAANLSNALSGRLAGSISPKLPENRAEVRLFPSVPMERGIKRLHSMSSMV